MAHYRAPLSSGNGEGASAIDNLHVNRLIDLPRRGGYPRDLCIEDESLPKTPEPDRLTILRQVVQALRDAST